MKLIKGLVKILLFPITLPIYIFKQFKIKKKEKSVSFEEFVENVKTLKSLKTDFKAVYSDERRKVDIEFKNKKGA